MIAQEPMGLDVERNPRPAGHQLTFAAAEESAQRDQSAADLKLW